MYGPAGNLLALFFRVKVVDQILQLSDKELLDKAKQLAREGGVLLWISSGAVAVAAGKIARRKANIGQLVVVYGAVNGYLSKGFSTGLSHENEYRRLQNHIDAAKFFALGTCENACEANSSINEWRR